MFPPQNYLIFPLPHQQKKRWQSILTRVAPHVTHEISPVAESLLALWAGVLALVGQAGCPAAAAWRERRGETALAAHVYNRRNIADQVIRKCIISASRIRFRKRYLPTISVYRSSYRYGTGGKVR